jgi:hypothetical protein
MAKAKDEAAQAKAYVVSRRKDGKWVVKPKGARCATKILASQEEATAFAQQLAASEGAEVIVEA